jgi:organic hydroperoxide reductase OsmC/OhrA
MSAPFPRRYSASLSRTFSLRALAEGSRPVLHTPAPALDGDVDVRSPEHMLLSSLGLCLLTTFQAFATRDGIDIHAWNAKASGTVEPTPEGVAFTSIVLEIDMVITGNVDRVEDTLEDAKQYCLVLNSLRIPVVIETQLRTPDSTLDLYDLPAELPPPCAPRMVAHRHAS